MVAGLVSHYRVVSPVGQGGMGVVYKAIDTRLNRPVALKTIPVGRDMPPEAIQRLRAEALAAASLDHPYICQIYELLETGQNTVIVMEYVEGETLAALLSRGTPDVRETVKYAEEIAEGLANAHAHGLVHRDVKPSNVMITPHGHVKLLDFGIVRGSGLFSGSAETLPALTGPGVAIGTPTYMAPEQALAKPVDARADLFALGVVLFECLSGQLPFAGATRDEYMRELLDGRLRSLDALAPSAPAGVRRLVEQCLQHDPALRPASASDVAAQLRSAADLLRGDPSIAPPWRRWARVAVPALLALALAATVGVAWRRARALPAAARIEVAAAVTDAAADTDPRISPDGKWLSFLSDRDGPTKVFVQAIDGGSPRALAIAADGILSHAWSPDGTEIACVAWHRNALAVLVVPAFFGGSSRLSVSLDPQPQAARLSRWTPAGIFADVGLGGAGRRLWRIVPDGSGVRDLTSTFPAGPKYMAFDVHPDGKQVVFAAAVRGRQDLWLAHGDDGSQPARLTDDEFVERGPVWTSPRAVAFESNRSGQLDLWEIDVRTRATLQVTASHTAESIGASTADASLLAFEQVDQRARLWRRDARGAHEQLTTDALSDFSPSTSRDGRRAAFQRTRPTLAEGYPFLDSQIAVAEAGQGRLGPASIVDDGFDPQVSPDGSWLAYLRRSPDPARLALRVREIETGRSRDPSAAVPLVAMSGVFPPEWVEQKAAWAGALLVFVQAGANGGSVAVFDPSVDLAARTILSASGWLIDDLRVSPDTLRVAYLRRKGEEFELRVRELGSETERLVLRATACRACLFLRGWTAAGALVVLRVSANRDGTDDVQVEEVRFGTTTRQVARLERVLAATARLDVRGTRLYLTRVEGGVHNIVEVPLAGGPVRPVTGNQRRGVSFSGIRLLSDGGMMYSRSEWERDIWLARKTR